ncbi:hypothetical protein [Stygiolobus caldivivus]|uniref:Uncharacterized protein n=1 Tax=Stygiolobus caldivivus TaxID=2824673 RepID=A0A8D5U6X0_9CREN|nr:hypothetical protein [Stygiolobus caldivivus]BCU70429.1 hypothetical protein KN1_17260 [Stygiolobus caldivivus]
MRRLFAFITPKREVSLRDYEIKMLRNIGKRFDLGRLVEYDRWDDGNIRYINAVFEKGKIRMKYVEGKEAIAEIKQWRSESLRF